MPDTNINLTLGIGSETMTATDAGPYFCKGVLTLPTIATGGGGSSVVVTVKQNGSTKYTSTAGDSGFALNLLCAAGDAIQVNVASSNPDDTAGKNAVRCTVSFGLGQ